MVLIEIEKKFLVVPGQWPITDKRVRITQGYMVRTDGLVLRVRKKNDQCYLSLKAKIDIQSSYDYEYLIPGNDADVMLENLCGDCVIEKTRHLAMHEGLMWEIDEFHGHNQGLVVAEIELPAADAAFNKPAWVAKEVTADSRYRNASLAANPFSQW